jgi:hypothetical protein
MSLKHAVEQVNVLVGGASIRKPRAQAADDSRAGPAARAKTRRREPSGSAV